MQSRRQEFEEAKTEIVAISVDTVETNRELADGIGVEFPLLSDPGLEAIDAFGVRHVGGGLDGDIARPAIFLADTDGRIVWRSLTENWRVRARPDELLERIRALD